MDYKDYYSILGVPKDVSKADLQRAYRKLARKYHPDVNREPEAEAKFKEINEAHEVLKDPSKRAKFDQFGSAWKQAQHSGSPPQGFEDIFSMFTGSAGPRSGFDVGGEGFSSFFEMLFGGGGGHRAAGRRARPSGFSGTGPSGFQQQGADHDAKLTLSLDEAARGGKREITLTDPSTGEHRTLRITIPKGVSPGQRIRLAGQGGPGLGGGPRGNLYLSVNLRPDPRFTLDGNNLHATLVVSPWEAALGGTADLPTLDGPVTVKIPPNSSSGLKIRLRGKGFPKTGGETGDLYAEIKIMLPAELSEREMELFESLAEESSFEPRK